jgi:uncharacterized protein with GYD domain
MPIAKDYSCASQSFSFASFLFARLTQAEHDFIPPDAGCSAGDEWEDIMKTQYTVALLLLGLVLPTGEAVGQQAGPTLHRYLVRAALTAEGLKNLQKQPPTALKAGVAKFVESVGGKLEFWYFDYGAATAYSVIDYPDEVSAATAQLSSNAAGYARVTIRPLLTAEEMDKAVAKWPPVRPPQQQ